MLLVGAAMILAALWLFFISMSKMMPFPPPTFMEFVILIFALLGIYFGISSGRKLAYTIHDRDIIIGHIQSQSQGRITTMISTIIRMPIMFTILTTIIWILFIIVLTLFRSMLEISEILTPRFTRRRGFQNILNSDNLQISKNSLSDKPPVIWRNRLVSHYSFFSDFPSRYPAIVPRTAVPCLA